MNMFYKLKVDKRLVYRIYKKCTIMDDDWDPPMNERGKLEEIMKAVKSERQKERKKIR